MYVVQARTDTCISSNTRAILQQPQPRVLTKNATLHAYVRYPEENARDLVMNT